VTCRLTELNSETEWDLMRFGKSQPRHQLSSVIAGIQIGYSCNASSLATVLRCSPPRRSRSFLLRLGELLRCGCDSTVGRPKFSTLTAAI